MCGIGGVMLFPKKRTSTELAFIRALVRGIATENQIRGRDSVGFAVFNDKGYSVLKQPIKAIDMVASPTYKEWEKRIRPTTKNILIHTRAATKGMPENNENNHPIETHRCVGVHNGMIHNDDELFQRFDLFRLAQVDSEVIFRLMDSRGKRLTVNNIKEVSSIMTGSFTYAFVPKQSKNRLYLVRNDNPVTLAYIPEVNAIVFASVAYFLNNAIKQANAEMGFDVADAKKTVQVIPSFETIYAFDTNANNPLEQLRQKPTSFTPLESRWSWRDEVSFEDSNSMVTAFRTDEILTYAQAIERLTEEEISAIEMHYEAIESMAWAEGYEKGRDSTGRDMEQIRALAYEKGYEKGLDDGVDMLVTRRHKASKIGSKAGR